MEQRQAKKILVTGGTGFTGSHLVRRMISRGHDVTVVDNQKGRFHDALQSLGARIEIGSITDKALVERLVAGQDVVHHVAAAFRRIDLPKAVYWNVNVEATRSLMDAALRHGVQKFVYTSTCGVHGNVTNPPAPESAPITPADYYQYTKYEGEKVAQEYSQRGLNVTTLRPAAIYGPGDPERWVMLFKRVATGRFPMFGSGKATYHPLYIDNLVDAYELAMEKEAAAGQTYLIADERYYALNDLVQAIADVLGKKVAIIHLPFWPAWLAALACEAVCAPLRISPPLFRRRVDWFRQNRAFDISKAKRELGYEPRVDLPTGLRRTAVWYEQQGYLPRLSLSAV
ncbi:MAG: NAD-dependent epimerase/dehydratase family protein [Chloroflexota bacterium]